MQAAGVLSRPARRPDLELCYGRDDQVADLWLPPAGPRPAAPLVLFLHGGFWRAAYDRRHAGPLAEAIAAAGCAVCVPEYRRVGQPGGGWPGTFDDVLAAVRAVPALVVRAVPALGAAAAADRAERGGLVLAGHSAGGHLALWAAAQPGAVPGPVISMAGVTDLAASYRDRLGQDAARGLMGGGPDQFPDRYRLADPMAAVPLAASVILIHGTGDDRVPARYSTEYAAAATAAGGVARAVLLPGAGHFDVIDPLSAAWPAVQAEFLAAAGLGRAR
jgi:acetyl esterase/lipase